MYKACGGFRAKKNEKKMYMLYIYVVQFFLLAQAQRRAEEAERK